MPENLYYLYRAVFPDGDKKYSLCKQEEGRVTSAFFNSVYGISCLSECKELKSSFISYFGNLVNFEREKGYRIGLERLTVNDMLKFNSFFLHRVIGNRIYAAHRIEKHTEKQRRLFGLQTTDLNEGDRFCTFGNIKNLIDHIARKAKGDGNYFVDPYGYTGSYMDMGLRFFTFFQRLKKKK